MSKLLKNVIVGIASGTAVAYFLTSEKGKELQQKAKKAYDAYKEDPTKYNQKANLLFLFSLCFKFTKTSAI